MARGPLLVVVALLAFVIVKAGPFSSGGLRVTAEGRRDSAAPERVTKTNAGTRERAAAGQALPPATDAGGLAPRLALGQMIVARFEGREPSPAFLARIRQGEVGGVILFEENLFGDEEAVQERIGRLQQAAREGDNPPLLTMVDQEGGTVKRLPGPPQQAAGQMSAEDAREEGEATGEMLARLGIDVDLAPVSDVRHRGSFLGSRSFGGEPEEVAERACEFAAGLREQGVAATLKHFPGLGWATGNTDDAPVSVQASPAALHADYAPYERCASEPLTLVMVDSAIYPSLTGDAPAVTAPATFDRELPRAGATGVTISDDLEAPAIRSQLTPARRSILAGLDLLLYARTESASATAYGRLLEDVDTGRIPAAKVEAAEVLALKAELAG